MFNSWSGSFAIILSPVGYSQTTCGWIGFCATVASMTGGLLAGFLGDKFFARRFKLLLFILLGLSTLALTWFTLSLPSVFSDEPLIPSNIYTVYVAIALVGLCLGSTNPLFYELGAETTFPTPEEVSAVFLTLVMNIICVVVLFVEPYIAYSYINTLVTASIILCLFALIFVREKYNRSDLDNSRKVPTE